MGDGGTPDGDLSAIPEHMTAVGAAAQQLEQALRHALDAVDRDVETLTRDDWIGLSSNAYRDTWAQCHRDGVRVLDALMRI